MTDPIEQIRRDITQHVDNRHHHVRGYMPLFSASPSAKIAIIGHAPGIKAQTRGKVWDDASGARLLSWLGIPEDTFRNDALVAHLPMDFYYPGRARSGDAPPRKGFAAQWHPELLKHMPNLELMILVGKHAQNYYLDDARGRTLTETVRNYPQYVPFYFPLVHPSPLNFRWFNKNPWFEEQVVPALQKRVQEALARPDK